MANTENQFDLVPIYLVVITNGEDPHAVSVSAYSNSKDADDLVQQLLKLYTLNPEDWEKFSQDSFYLDTYDICVTKRMCLVNVSSSDFFLSSIQT